MTQKWLTELGLYIESIGPAMVTMGEAVSRAIKRRTKLGVDRNGAAFLPYSKRYAERKGSNRVNLYGKEQPDGRPHLLNSFGIDEAGKQRVVLATRGRGSRFRVQETGQFASIERDMELAIVFNNPESARIGWAHEEGLNTGKSRMKPRPWMGLSGPELTEAFNEFGTRLHVMRSTQENVDITLNFG